MRRALSSVADEASGGAYLSHDNGYGTLINGQTFSHDMPVEENCNYLLMMQAYAHWTGDLEPAKRHRELITQLSTYLTRARRFITARSRRTWR